MNNRVFGMITSTVLGFAILAGPLYPQTPIAYGDLRLGTIGCGGTVTFEFEGNVGDRVVLHCIETSDFGGVCGGACFCFDQEIKVMDPNDSVIASAVSPFGNNTQNRSRTQLSTLLASTGTYRITVKDRTNNGRGTFALFLQRSNNPRQALPLSANASLLVALTTAGQVESFSFMATEGSQIVVSNTVVTGSVRPRLALYDELGFPVALPPTGEIDTVVSTRGRFTLLAFSAVDELGTYNVNLSVLPSPPLEIAYPGTGEDLVLEMGVNAQYGRFPDIQSAVAGDRLTLHLDSPLGTLSGFPHVIIGQMFTTGSPPAGSAPGIHIDLFSTPPPIVLFDGLPGPLGSPIIPIGGVSLGFEIPVGLSGMSVMIQAGVFSADAKNGLYATTHGHEVRFL